MTGLRHHGIEAKDVGSTIERFPKRIVDVHGGRLSIESRPNEGTTAGVWLPAAVD